EDKDEQRQGALPVVRQILGQQHRHVALLEVPGQYHEAEQQHQEVDQHDPFVDQMVQEASNAGGAVEVAEQKLVEADDDDADQRDVEGVVMEQCDAEQHGGEQQELHGDAQNAGRGTGRLGGQAEAGHEGQQQETEQRQQAGSGGQKTARGHLRNEYRHERTS